MKNLANVYRNANEIVSSEQFKSAVKSGNAEFATFSSVIRNMQTKAVFEKLLPGLQLLGIEQVADLNVSNLMNNVFAPDLFITKTKKDGTTERRFGLLREVEKKHEVDIYDKNGNAIMNADGTQMKVSIVERDAEGNAIVEIKHAGVKSWTILKVMTAIAQSRKYAAEPEQA